MVTISTTELRGLQGLLPRAVERSTSHPARYSEQDKSRRDDGTWPAGRLRLHRPSPPPQSPAKAKSALVLPSLPAPRAEK